MASEDDEPTPHRPMTDYEVIVWFFGKSRLDEAMRLARCARCVADAEERMSEFARRYADWRKDD